MRKFFSIIYLIILFFIIYFLQTNFFTWFTISGVMPNLFIVLMLFIGLFVGKKIGFYLGIIFGICLDLFTAKTIGITGIMLGTIGLIGEYLDKAFSKDNRLTIILMTTGSTIFYEIGMYILKILKNNITIEILPFLKILLIELIYNIILVIIFYPIIKKSGELLENTFKEKEILTRYF